ncbi:Phenylacetate-coenzyme A ligase [Rhodoplanes serenus]|uniref:Phenylacetate-coenzyme A ligase n=1 Tax=Rhodoplanes serenus TaxID=200615 RepID=A0A3S4B3V6_9BRAD|nr:AMP-binding protein [Rhodoplanes serenus]VCU10849.1 Phenylacetate-coenzyme A ligase [Rhodoplanes serenus]
MTGAATLLARTPEHYDTRESRDPALRERDLMARLPGLLAHAMQAPGWRRHLAGVDPAAVTARQALRALPLLRKSDLVGLQAADPPLGGFACVPTTAFRRLFVSPGPVAEPEGEGRDWWGMAAGLFAAGFRAGDVALNCFSYHLTPGAYLAESGLRALGGVVIPGGVGNTDQQVEAIRRYRPVGYLGTGDFLKIILDRAAETGRHCGSLTKAFTTGAALPPSLRAALADHGVAALQGYATADVGLIAYETIAETGLVVNEDRIVEIVRPGTGDPVPDGEIGEVVVTTFTRDYPMIRFATGDLSAVRPGRSDCGRTNIRLAGWLGRADQSAKVKGMFVHPSQVAEIARRHGDIGAVRLVVLRTGEQDAIRLEAEVPVPSDGLRDALADTLRDVTKLTGEIVLLRPGTLPEDGRRIVDTR